jgi:hypothetical protein
MRDEGNVRFGLRIQPINATHRPKRSAFTELDKVAWGKTSTDGAALQRDPGRECSGRLNKADAPSCRRYSVKRPSALILVLDLLLSTCLAQASPPADEVTGVVRAEMARQQIPGLALLVARNGVPIRSEGYGLANVELNVPVKPETIFQSGSIGKQFTAAAVLMLADAGKIGLAAQSLDNPTIPYVAQGLETDVARTAVLGSRAS